MHLEELALVLAAAATFVTAVGAAVQAVRFPDRSVPLFRSKRAQAGENQRGVQGGS